MKLYGPSFNHRVTKILIAANYAGIKLDLEEYAPRNANESAKSEYLKKNPNGKVPTLETDEGFLFESNTILRYIARLSKGHKLYGNNIYEESLVDQHLDWLITSFEPVYQHVNFPLRGKQPYNKEIYEKAVESLKEMLKIVEDILKTTQYLVGSTITIADIFLVQNLSFLFRFAFDEKARKPFPNLVKYYLALANEENFKSVMGRPALCKNALKPYISPEEVAAAKQDKKKKGAKEETKQPEKKEDKKEDKKAEKKAEKAEKKAEKPEKKAEKPKEAKKETKKAAEPEEEEEKPKEKSEKNPLDLLPPTSFNLFDFKTLIVNAQDKKAAVKTFFEQYDPQGFSIWFITYDKAEGEGNVLFLTNNLMNGFLQRLEHFRKYAYGIHGVYGEEPNLEIRGVWVWRGTDIPQEIKEHDSYEFYKFHKLDHTKAEDRKKLEEFWSGMNEDEDIVDGLRARTVRYFK